MLKRLSIFLSIMGLLLTANAQLATGSWRQFPSFGKFSALTDTPDKVYYITAGSLYAYDKKADETRHFQCGTDLSDVSVDKIFFNYDEEYLLVAFSNGNMDILLPDGTRINLPDIKDATIPVTKAVNDVKFYGGDIYVATPFGLVIYNGKNHEVRESGIYNRPVQCLAVDSERIMIIMGDKVDGYYHIYSIAHGSRINTLENFTLIGREPWSITKAESMDKDSPYAGQYYPVIQAGTVRRINAKKWGAVNTGIKARELQHGKDGLYFFSNTTPAGYYTLTEEAMAKAETAMPATLDGNMFSSWDGTSVWAGDPSGLGNYTVTSDGKVTVKRDKSVPSDAISLTNICRIYPTADGRGLYAANIGQSHNHPIGTSDRTDVIMEAALFRDGTFTNFYPPTSDGRDIIAPTAIAEDPDDPSVVYVASTDRGVYVFKDGKQINLIDGSNSIMTKMGNWIFAPSSIKFDRYGNLWVGYVGGSATIPSLMILPSAKRRDIANVKKEDWIRPDIGSMITSKDVTVLPLMKSDVAIIFDSKNENGFVAFGHGGDPNDKSKASHMEWRNITDQDGKKFSPEFFLCMTEDHNGQVWIGTTSGVISIPNPTRALSTDFNINRVKVPRNDGTNLADYLLESDRVCSIAVDNSNRKWLGTEASGIFLVSENGDEILANYNTSNSPLPTNTVTAIYADPGSGSVFVGTMSGLLEFSSTSGPAHEDYSDVYAYPNPVTPEYTGWVTIQGLMADSMVKIVDAGFHTVYQTHSEGGTAIWDVCNHSGERVRSGVYYVLASTSGDTSSAGDVVTKILVIN